MGETIRYLMVATVAVGSILGISPSQQCASAQGTGGAMQLPSSLSQSLSTAISGAFGNQPAAPAAQVNARGNPPAPAYQTPGYGAAANPAMATTRPDGPSTAPTATRDNSWMTGATQGNGARPSTNPFPPRTANTSTTRSNQLSDKLRQDMMGTKAGAAATRQSPGLVAQPAAANSSIVAPNFSRPGSAGTGSAGTGSAGTGAAGPGFGGLPGGVNLPQRTPSQSNPAGQPQYGVKTSTASGFDASLFNTSANAAARTGAQSQTATGSMLGMPAANTVQTNSSLPTHWTKEQVIFLGAKFGLPASDPRLNDQKFMNDLSERWQEHLAKQSLASRGTAASTLGNPATGTIAQTQYELAQLQAQRQRSLTAPASNLLTDPRAGQGITAAVPPMTTPWASKAVPTKPADVDPRLSQKDIDGLPPGAYSYDGFGNSIDRNGRILNRFGERVSEKEAWDLTHGKTKRERELTPAREIPVTHVASTRTKGVQVPQNGTVLGADTTTSVSRPPVLPPDHAGIGGGAKVLGRSNPYINIFLLASLVANAFLFIWLHRLWSHYRELVASSRLAASGISTNE